MILSPGSVIAGKFRLERPLAQGGMGSVWVAFNVHLEVPVALKFMAPALVSSGELVARFEREAKAAAQLRNPHVVQIFEHGVDSGTPFIAMELLEGEDLGTRLRLRGRLSLQETSRIVGDVCKALRRAHDMGVIHRDLKPANIYLCKHDEYEVVKVLDFGIAKSMAPGTQDEATKTGALVGSPHYMSPEQARRTGKQVDHRSDLWAVGVIAFRCLTGRLPYPGDDVIDVLVRVCTEAVPAPSSLAPGLGPEVDRFFVRALAREQNERFQSAREMAEALAAMVGQPASRDSLSSLEPSRSDLRIALPQPSDPGVLDDALDSAKTVPIGHAAAQRAIEGRPWAAAVSAPATFGVPAASNGTRPMGPVGPAGSAQPEAPVIVRDVPRGATLEPTWKLPPEAPPASLASGTLTSAGAELGLPPPATPGGRDRSWIALGAALAGVVVIGVVASAVFLTGDSADGTAAGGEDGAPGASAAAASALVANGAATSEPSTNAPGAATAAPEAPPASAPAGASATLPNAATAAPSAVPSVAASSSPSAAISQPTSAGTGTGKGKGTAAPAPKPTSGFLQKAKF